jgi:hypothetical protein
LLNSQTMSVESKSFKEDDDVIASKGTPFVDMLLTSSSIENDEQEIISQLQQELTRSLQQERDFKKSLQHSLTKLQEEDGKLNEVTQLKIQEHEVHDKMLIQFQQKLSISQPIVDDLEKTLRRLQDEAERARR